MRKWGSGFNLATGQTGGFTGGVVLHLPRSVMAATLQLIDALVNAGKEVVGVVLGGQVGPTARGGGGRPVFSSSTSAGGALQRGGRRWTAATKATLAVLFLGSVVGGVRYLMHRRRAVRVKGSLVFVVGSLRDVGRAVAVEAVSRGATVVCLSSSREDIEKVQVAVTQANVHGGKGSMQSYVVGAAGGSAYAAATAEAVARHGVPDLVVHCPDRPPMMYLHESPERALHAWAQNMLLHGSCAIRAVLPDMVRRGRGGIVFVQAAGAYVPFSGATAHVTGSYALRGLAEALRVDTFGSGVYVQEAVVNDACLCDSSATTPCARVPALMRLAGGTTSPAEAADIILDAAETGKSRVVKPVSLQALLAIARWSPNLVFGIQVATGWRKFLS